MLTALLAGAPSTCADALQVNTASRMESSGEQERIQMSRPTAFMLSAQDASLQQRVWRRPGAVDVKGKGTMQTYFLVSQSQKNCLACWQMRHAMLIAVRLTTMACTWIPPLSTLTGRLLTSIVLKSCGPHDLP